MSPISLKRCVKTFPFIVVFLLISTFCAIHVSNSQAALKGDINGDGFLDLADVVLALKVVAGMNPAEVRDNYPTSDADIDDGEQLGIEEIIYGLQRISGIRNTRPVANAGSNRTVVTNSTITLDGSSSSDPDDDPITYSWSLESKPTGSNAELSNPSAKNPTFTPDIDGDYLFHLVINDGIMDSEPAIANVTAGPLQPAGWFPFYRGALWFYTTEVSHQSGMDTTTENGIIGVTVSELYLDDTVAKISVTGDLDYASVTYQIPDSVYLRKSGNILEVSDSQSRPWEKVLDLEPAESWDGSFILAPDSYHPSTGSSLSMSLDNATLSTDAGTFPGLEVKSEYDNSTEPHVIEVFTRYSKEFFTEDIGLIAASKRSYYYDRSVIDDIVLSESNMSISFKGYYIPKPDGTLVEGGDVLEAPNSAPLAPSELSLFPASNSQIDLSWKDYSHVEQGFKIERKARAAGEFSEIGSVTTDVTEYSDTGLEETTTYYYRIKAYNTNADSGYSDIAHALTDGPPRAPLALTATYDEANRIFPIRVSWEYGLGEAEGFEIEYKIDNGNWALLDWMFIPTPPEGSKVAYVQLPRDVDHPMNSGEIWYFRMRTYNSWGYSEYSNVASALIP